MTTIFLLSGATSFPDPGNWNPANNKVEMLGGGFRGAGSFTNPNLLSGDDPEVTPLTLRQAGAGGGGGAYAYATNLTNTFPVALNVAAKDQTGISANPSFYGSWWNSYSNTPPSNTVQAGSGDQTNVAGGAGGSLHRPNGFNGGNGGSISGINNGDGGGGGGGAAGPHGNGTNGGGTTTTTPGAGGAADAATNAGGAAGVAGSSGTQWDASHGCGGGGGGGFRAPGLGGGIGGPYGGGGGGQAGDTTASTFGAGQPGLMIITYTPLVAAAAQARGAIIP